MKFDPSPKFAVRLVALSFSFLVGLAGVAAAMPVGGAMSIADDRHLLQRTAIGQHRIYPGSNSAQAEKARADRNAPNLFCEKQETRCE